MTSSGHLASTPSAPPHLSLAYVTGVASLAPLGLNVAVGLQPVFGQTPLDGSGRAATVALLALGLGLGQPVAGDAADRWGRRVTLLAGLALASLGAWLCVLADTPGTLMAGRFLTGLGLSTCLVVPRTCLRDLHEGVALQRSMAVLALVFAFLPAITPPLSWALAQDGTWRTPLGLLALLVGAGALLAWRWQHETRPAGTHTPRWSSWGQLARQRPLQRITLAFAGIAAPFFIIAAAGPAALQASTGVGGGTAASVLGLSYLGFAVGNHWVRQRAHRPGATLFRQGLVLAAAGMACLAGSLLWPSLWLWTLALTVYAVGHGMVFPAAFAMALGGHARQAGLVTAGIGTVHMCTGALSAWATPWLPRALSAHQAVVFSTATMTLLAIAAWFFIPHHKEAS